MSVANVTQYSCIIVVVWHESGVAIFRCRVASRHILGVQYPALALRERVVARAVLRILVVSSIYLQSTE